MTTNNLEDQPMLDHRTIEILAAIKRAATCTPDLLPLLETARTLHDCADKIDAIASTRTTGARYADQLLRHALRLRLLAYKLEQPVSRALGQPVVLSSTSTRRMIEEARQ
jgi:hypothetical protein